MGGGWTYGLGASTAPSRNKGTNSVEPRESLGIGSKRRFPPLQNRPFPLFPCLRSVKKHPFISLLYSNSKSDLLSSIKIYKHSKDPIHDRHERVFYFVDHAQLTIHQL